DDETGFHAAAFVTGGDDPTVIIGFEGTDASGLLQRPDFLAAQIEADLALFFGYRPEALQQAVGFAETVVEAARQKGIPESRVVVTGHSLGAAEAAYVATQLGLGGTTFAAPGLNQDYIVFPGSNLTNYVTYGDPVGNYSATPRNYEGAFLFDRDIRRVGEPTYLDITDGVLGPVERRLLITATEKFDVTSGSFDPALGFAEVGALAATFHPLTFYGSQFSPSLNTGAPVQVDAGRIIDGTEYLRLYGDLADRSGLVSDAFYNIRYADVRAAGVDPEAHYAKDGWREGRDPNPYFSTLGYRAANPSVAAAGTDPLAQYHAEGWLAGRDPGANFDTRLYLERNPDVRAAGIDPLAHYLDYGRYEGRATESAIGEAADLAAGRGFDADYYLLANPDVAAAALKTSDSLAYAKAHYDTYGWREGRDGNALFDTEGYLTAYADVREA
ncbi:lipase family protein, partial [Methylobacterium frigidaeris]